MADYLVTGGAGFIGSNLCVALQALGSVAVCDSFGQDEKWKNLRTCTLDDIFPPEDLDIWLQAHGHTLKAIFHMGAVSATTERDVDLIIRSNIQLSLKLWDYAAAQGVAFIYASSAATYGDGSKGFDDSTQPEYQAQLRPLNAYGWSKLMFDRLVLARVRAGHAAPPKWAGLKFFNVYGPREAHKGAMRSVITSHFAALQAGAALKLFASDHPDYKHGEQQRDFVYVGDCCDVMLWMLQHDFPADVYNIGTGKAQTWLEAGHAMFKALGRAPEIEFIPMPEILKGKYQYHTQAHTDKLMAIGAPLPRTSLEEGVRRTYAYLASEQE